MFPNVPSGYEIHNQLWGRVVRCRRHPGLPNGLWVHANICLSCSSSTRTYDTLSVATLRQPYEEMNSLLMKQLEQLALLCLTTWKWQWITCLCTCSCMWRVTYKYTKWALLTRMRKPLPYEVIDDWIRKLFAVVHIILRYEGFLFLRGIPKWLVYWTLYKWMIWRRHHLRKHSFKLLTNRLLTFVCITKSLRHRQIA